MIQDKLIAVKLLIELTNTVSSNLDFMANEHIVGILALLENVSRAIIFLFSINVYTLINLKKGIGHLILSTPSLNHCIYYLIPTLGKCDIVSLSNPRLLCHLSCIV